mgnify:CR=1 FL=1
MNNFPLFERFPTLSKIPKLDLGKFPTPVDKLENISKINPNIEVYIKRDDLSSDLYGGNKVRKYEFVLADALQKKKTEILTTGGIGSNHALANTIFAKQLILNSHVFLFDQPLNDLVRKNLLLDSHYGAKMHYTKGYGRTALAMIRKYLFDRKSYLIMPGASTPLGTIGFVNAAMELQNQIDSGQCPPIDELFVAVGSTGTCAGLSLGLELINSPVHVTGVTVSMIKFSNKKAVLKQMKNTLKLLRKYDSNIPDVSNRFDARLDVDESFFGGLYGKCTYEAKYCIKELKKDGITLDPTYTAKTFSCLMHQILNAPKFTENTTSEKKRFLFWHTLNSKDLSDLAKRVNYHNLPKSFHKFFDGSVPEDTTPVWCDDSHIEEFSAH